MFKFGFADPAGGDAGPAIGADLAKESAGPSSSAQVAAEEVLASEGVPTGAQETVAVSPSLSLIKGVVSNAQAAAVLSDQRVADNDLIAGVYEGGFKTWEGGLDLARHVAAALEERGGGQHASDVLEDEQQQRGRQLRLGPGCRVMELGCGSGLPGLVALWAGAEVHFQDYNRSVLATLTIQNVAANSHAWHTRQQAAGAAGGAAGGAGAAGSAGTAAAAGAAAAEAASPAPVPAASRARYIAGSWDGLPALLDSLGLLHSYDLVLTAETIYSPEASASLYAAIKACLRRTGVALVAAKSYYFGVGGGTAAFADMVAADGVFECTQVAVLDDGLSNKREILRLDPQAEGAAEAAAAAQGQGEAAR